MKSKPTNEQFRAAIQKIAEGVGYFYFLDTIDSFSVEETSTDWKINIVPNKIIKEYYADDIKKIGKDLLKESRKLNIKVGDKYVEAGIILVDAIIKDLGQRLFDRIVIPKGMTTEEIVKELNNILSPYKIQVQTADGMDSWNALAETAPTGDVRITVSSNVDKSNKQLLIDRLLDTIKHELIHTKQYEKEYIDKNYDQTEFASGQEMIDWMKSNEESLDKERSYMSDKGELMAYAANTAQELYDRRFRKESLGNIDDLLERGASDWLYTVLYALSGNVDKLNIEDNANIRYYLNAVYQYMEALESGRDIS